MKLAKVNLWKKDTANERLGGLGGERTGRGRERKGKRGVREGMGGESRK